MKLCENCDETGKTPGIGGIEKSCEICSWDEKFENISCSVFPFKWVEKILKKWPVAITVVIFIGLFITFFYQHAASSTNPVLIAWITALLGSFGSIFAALKYKLDQANYHKSLFKKRNKIFKKVDKILSDLNHDYNKQEILKKMDSIYRQSYLLFSDETYQFISEFKEAVSFIIYKTSALNNPTSPDDIKFKKKVEQAQKFLNSLLDGQNLTKRFPELKIDTY